MSNYLLAFGASNIITEIYDIFNHESEGGSEISVVELNQDISFLSISKSEVIHTIGQSTIFFKGWFKDHNSETIVLGEDGFLNWLKMNENRNTQNNCEFEGTYVSAKFENEKLSISNDIFSYFPIIHFSGNNFFACSDSLFIISELRKRMGIPCKLNKEVMYSRAWTHGLASAAMSNQTQIQGVELLSPGKHLEIDITKSVSSNAYILETNNIVKSKNLKETFASNFRNYQQAIRDITTKLTQSVTSFLHLDEVLISLGLSGGLDSRIIFAAILQKPELLEKIQIQTNTHSSREGDYKVVKKLSEIFGFEHNNSDKMNAHMEKFSLKREKIADQYSLWVLSSMGLFDMMYLHDTYWSTPHIIEMGGHGAESLKGTFTEMKFSNLFPITRYFFREINKIPLKLKKRRNIRKVMSKGLMSHGIDIDEYASINWHYLCYKSPIANGRFLNRSSISIRPFIQQSLFSLAISEINPFRNTDTKEPTMLHDILILLNPELAAIDFENPKTNISEEYIQSRLKALGGRLDLSEIKPYSVYGTIKKMKNGPPDIFLKMVKHNFKPNGDAKESILGALEYAWSNISNKEIKHAYRAAYETAIERFEEGGCYIPNAGAPAAKIISLELNQE